MTAWLLGGHRDLNCDCFKKGRGLEQLVSQRDDLNPALGGPNDSRSLSLNLFFASQTLCLVLKFSGNIWPVTSELHDKQLWKVHNSCLCSHPASMLLSRVWVVCVSQKKWFNNKLCIYFYLRFFFLQGVHCSVFVFTVNQCFNHYLYITAF